jgi:hypothetical protein
MPGRYRKALASLSTGIVVLAAGSSSWGPAATLSIESDQGQAHDISMAVNSGGPVMLGE